MTETVLALATVASGLVAGLFAAFAYAVSPGLRRMDEEAFVQIVRAVDAAILNPVHAGSAPVGLRGPLERVEPGAHRHERRRVRVSRRRVPARVSQRRFDASCGPLGSTQKSSARSSSRPPLR